MLETIGQLAVIVAGIIGGFGWLISFLQKKFATMYTRFQSFEEKLDNKVTEELCKQRRAHLPCCSADGTFRCPVGAPSQQVSADTLSQLVEVLKKLEKKN